MINCPFLIRRPFFGFNSYPDKFCPASVVRAVRAWLSRHEQQALQQMFLRREPQKEKKHFQTTIPAIAKLVRRRHHLVIDAVTTEVGFKPVRTAFIILTGTEIDIHAVTRQISHTHAKRQRRRCHRLLYHHSGRRGRRLRCHSRASHSPYRQTGDTCRRDITAAVTAAIGRRVITIAVITAVGAAIAMTPAS